MISNVISSFTFRYNLTKNVTRSSASTMERCFASRSMQSYIIRSCIPL